MTTEKQDAKRVENVLKIASKALKMGKSLAIEYDGLPRIVEVHAIGVSKAGRMSLRVYQTTGDSLKGNIQGWKLLSVGKILEAPKLLDTNSSAPREGYQQNDAGLIEIVDQL